MRISDKPIFLVETLAITGKWVPWFVTGQTLLTYFQAAMETFHARLIGMRSRIVIADCDIVLRTVPPRALHINPQELAGMLRAYAKIHKTPPMGRNAP